MIRGQVDNLWPERVQSQNSLQFQQWKRIVKLFIEAWSHIKAGTLLEADNCRFSGMWELGLGKVRGARCEEGIIQLSSQLNGCLHLLSHRPNVVRSPGYYVSSSLTCGVCIVLAVPFISPCLQVACWRPHSCFAIIHRVVPVHSESWVNCAESIYSWPIACRLARSLALYPPHTSRFAPRILPSPVGIRSNLCKCHVV